MRSYIFLLLIFLLSLCCPTSASIIDTAEVSSIQIIYVPTTTCTPFDISPALFDKSCFGIEDTVIIKDTKSLSCIKAALQELEECEWYSLDTRGKMILYFKDGSKDSLYISHNILLWHGVFFDCNDRLRTAIDNAVLKFRDSGVFIDYPSKHKATKRATHSIRKRGRNRYP